MIKNILDKHLQGEARTENEDLIFFVQFFNIDSIKNDKKQLRSIVREYVKPTDTTKTVNIMAYFKPLKLSAFFSTRPKPEDLKRTDVVYQFQCPDDSCNATLYVGHTTCRLERRVRSHRSTGSGVYKHFALDHNTDIPSHDELKNCFSVLDCYPNRTQLKLAEALYIRKLCPSLNIKYN